MAVYAIEAAMRDEFHLASPELDMASAELPSVGEEILYPTGKECEFPRAGRYPTTETRYIIHRYTIHHKGEIYGWPTKFPHPLGWNGLNPLKLNLMFMGASRWEEGFHVRRYGGDQKCCEVSGNGNKKTSSTEAIWGKPVLKHGFTSIPSILIQAQSRLGITPLQMNILIQLMDYWHERERKPFPTKEELARRIGVTAKTIQNNIRTLEKAEFVRREGRKTACGDWSSNIYHLDGLVERIQKMEPEFSEAQETRRQARQSVETPVGRRPKE